MTVFKILNPRCLNVNKYSPENKILKTTCVALVISGINNIPDAGAKNKHWNDQGRYVGQLVTCSKQGTSSYHIIF